MHPLATIGYENTTLARVIETLTAHRVRAVVDVRALANSRRPGFAKNLLSSSLNAAGIGYCHLPSLGTPAEGREAARRGDTERMRSIFRDRLAGPEAQQGMMTLTRLIEQAPCCLLCLESNPHDCHRLLIADAMQDRSAVTVTHLYPGGGWAPLPKKRSR